MNHNNQNETYMVKIIVGIGLHAHDLHFFKECSELEYCVKLKGNQKGI